MNLSNCKRYFASECYGNTCIRHCEIQMDCGMKSAEIIIRNAIHLCQRKWWFYKSNLQCNIKTVIHDSKQIVFLFYARLKNFFQGSLNSPCPNPRSAHVMWKVSFEQVPGVTPSFPFNTLSVVPLDSVHMMGIFGFPVIPSQLK